ncbi:MAG: hypothetical protein U0271_39095 [Polyangiaceae bacterium]
MTEPDPYKTVGTSTTTATRPFFWTLAAWGAWLAAVYWTFVLVLILMAEGLGGFGTVSGVGSSILVFFYALHGFRLLSGKASAAGALLLLHAIGGGLAIFQIVSSNVGAVVLLNVVKVAINAFGFGTALVALGDIRMAEVAPGSGAAASGAPTPRKDA